MRQLTRKPSFNAKVLLFGEYGMLENSKGLTIPCEFFQGGLKISSERNKEQNASNLSITKLADYLKQNAENLKEAQFDFTRLEEDLSYGLYFESNIPQGYGVGSSGALVAALFSNYAKGFESLDKEKMSSENIQKLKKIFSLMESHFHGTSSGIDPLICYLGLPLLIESKEEIGTVGIPNPTGQGAIFLLDTEEIGKTAPMVEFFFEKIKNHGFRKTLKEEFIKYNDASVEAFLKGDLTPLMSNVKELSSWVFDNLNPMIPSRIQKIWKQGIESNTYYLKLCGSGNGGYVLGFTKDFTKTKEILKDYPVTLLHQL